MDASAAGESHIHMPSNAAGGVPPLTVARYAGMNDLVGFFSAFGMRAS